MISAIHQQPHEANGDLALKTPTLAAPGRFPPGPKNGLFGASHLRSLKNDLLGFMAGLQAEYGDVATYRIGPLRFFQFSHPDYVNAILVKNAGSFRKLRSVKWYFKRWMGDGLLLNDGKSWFSQRRKVRWALLQHTPQAKNTAIVEAVSSQIRPASGGAMDWADAMNRVAFYANVRLLYGQDTPAVFEPLYEASDTLHAIGVQEMTNVSLLPDWFPLHRKAVLRRAMRTYNSLIEDHVKSRAERAPDAPDGLSLLLSAVDRQGRTSGMSIKQVRDETANLLMGGKETVGATLTWAGYLLAMHPEVQEQVAAEARQAEVHLGNPVSLDRLPLCQAVIIESMRLYPPVYMLAREVARPITIGDIRLKRGNQVHIAVHVMHRDSRWWRNPEQFDPSRFMARDPERPRYAFVPFGAGRRNCVGKEIGWEQCVLCLAQLAANFRFSSKAETKAPEWTTDIVLHPKHPLFLKVDARVPA